MEKKSKQAPSPGWRTTEFWVTVLPIVVIGGLLAAGVLSVEDVLRLWPLLASGGAYALSRGAAKS